MKRTFRLPIVTAAAATALMLAGTHDVVELSDGRKALRSVPKDVQKARKKRKAQRQARRAGRAR